MTCEIEAEDVAEFAHLHTDVHENSATKKKNSEEEEAKSYTIMLYSPLS